MIYDTHAHLSGLAERGVDPHKTLQGLFSSGFAGLIDISLEPGDLAARMEEFSIYPNIYFASGLWPWGESITSREKLTGELEKVICSIKKGRPAGRLCALGEFGLDRNWNGEGKNGSDDLEGEVELMEMQMIIAEKNNLPVIIHSRDAARETAEVVKRYPLVRGVIHCFSYGSEEAKTFLDLGYYISFAGNLTYKNAYNIQDACKLIPNNRLILETDCPYLAPVPYRGKPAHPGMVEEIYKKAAELRRASIEDIAVQIKENINTLFGIF